MKGMPVKERGKKKVWISKKKLKSLEKQIADLENKTQGQQTLIESFKEIFVRMGVSENYFQNVGASQTRS